MGTPTLTGDADFGPPLARGSTRTHKAALGQALSLLLFTQRGRGLSRTQAQAPAAQQGALSWKLQPVWELLSKERLLV